MIRQITEEELMAARANAVKASKELNKLFANTSVDVLVSTGRITFSHHPMVKSGELGEAYKKGSEHWADNGALLELFSILDGVKGERPKFIAGTFGSVWFDVELTGGIGNKKRTKQVRVTPTRNGAGGWDIMLDNTFDDEW